MTSSLPSCVWRRSLRSVVSRVVAACSVVLIGCCAVAAADDVVRNQATIVQGHDQTKELDHGNSTTEFSLRLPDPTCPGDSANDQWKVQTFMVPVGTSVDTLRYGAAGPFDQSDNRWALFDTKTDSYSMQFTLRNPAAGSPGTIPTPPAFDFKVVAQAKVPAGDYTVGLACTLFGKTGKVWSQQITVEYIGDQFNWRLSTAPPSVLTSSKSNSVWWVVGAIALAIVVLVLFLSRVSRRSSLPKESS